MFKIPWHIVPRTQWNCIYIICELWVLDPLTINCIKFISQTRSAISHHHPRQIIYGASSASHTKSFDEPRFHRIRFPFLIRNHTHWTMRHAAKCFQKKSILYSAHVSIYAQKDTHFSVPSISYIKCSEAAIRIEQWQIVQIAQCSCFDDSASPVPRADYLFICHLPVPIACIVSARARGCIVQRRIYCKSDTG